MFKKRKIKPRRVKQTKQKRKNTASGAPPSFTDFLSWLAEARARAPVSAVNLAHDLCGASTPHSRAVLSALRSLHHYQTNHCEAAASMFSTEDYKFLIVVVNNEELIKSIRATVAASGKIISEPGVIEGKPN